MLQVEIWVVDEVAQLGVFELSWAETGHELLGCACGRTIMLALPVIRNCGGAMSRNRTKSEVQERLAYIESGLELLHSGKLVHLPGTCLGRKVRRYFVRTTRIAEVSGAPQRLDAHRRGYQGSTPENKQLLDLTPRSSLSFWSSLCAPRSSLGTSSSHGQAFRTRLLKPITN